jgi:hypothetical protein
MRGVLPYIYKYASVLLNLTSFNIKKRGVNPYNDEKKKNTIVNDLVHNLELASKLSHNYKLHIPALKEIIEKIGNSSNEIRENSPEEMPHDNTDDGKDSKLEAKKKRIKEKTQKLSTKIEEMSKEIISLCKNIIEDIEKKYQGSKYVSELV